MRSDPPAARAPVRGARAGEAGSAVVDFALVGALVAVVALALLQLALGLHVRNVLIDAAGEGARRAALVGGTTAEAEARVRALAGAALSGDCVQAVEVRRTRAGDLAVVEVRVLAALPVLGLLGPGGGLAVTGHAVDEAALAAPPGAGRG
ncbi:pilus assembly protein TadE [Actinomyces sp. oral taxon 414]|uniref:TadE/TadG family type IV pilus assembly protein n=1 Tax=Actinomyces sp. oral taxon 414 TaxID=712122 RepID=UPI0006AFE474|nr:TadE/TadG family type IV pilus assembly protein [Actinomyces sp. oral taxon 414]ALC98717.1 pilus assembly protein TadE [Actinomyces sp. oral taxon 414]